MTIEQKIRERLSIAMKNNNAFEKSILRTILGEFSRIGKDIDDSAAQKVLLMMRNALAEIGSLDALKEAALISEYLPRVMEKEEIEKALSAIIISNEDIKFKALKDAFDKEYPGQDGALVAQCIKVLI